jgi:hypothetical protein
VEPEPRAAKLKGMKEAPSPLLKTMIPNSDWDMTPLSVKQWVASREQGIQELEQQLAAQQ